jgi:hypothetical protein
MIGLTIRERSFFVTDTFHAMGLPTTTHTAATREILDNKPDKSKFIRAQVLKFAASHGFEWAANGYRPGFMSDEKWQRYSELSGKSRHIDYTFLVAYDWLKSLDKFHYSTDANLMRLIVLSEL